MSDWRKRLRRASFRGAGFWVDSDGFEGGRRVAIHEFPHAEAPYNEDLGQQARRYTVTAYTVGDQADAQAKSLISACTAQGAASLVLPMFGGIRARCLEISTDRSKDKQGFVAFRLLFLEDGAGNRSSATPQQIARQVEHSVSTLTGSLQAAFRAGYDGLDVPEYVLEAAARQIREFATTFDAARTRTPLAPAAEPKIQDAIEALFDDARELASIGARGNRFDFLVYVEQDRRLEDSLTGRVFALFDAFREATTPEIARLELATFAEYDTSELPVPLTTLSRRREAENRESLLSLFRRSALVQYAVATVQRTYETRREAIAARAEVTGRFQAELDKITRANQFELFGAMQDLLGKTVDFLSRSMADLAPVLTIEARALMPSLYWAARLYDDAVRAEELWARNGVKHPSFMPVRFEALAR